MYQKQEARSSDNTVETDALNESAKHKKKQSRKSRKKSCLALSVSSSSQSSAESSDSDSDGDTESLLSTSSQKRCGAPRSGRLVLPFTAKKESWTVWFARFKAIADDNNWSGQERLSVLLPKLQGAAGEYVFEVLSKRIRSDYKKLVRELDACYHKVESKQNYRRQLTGISQKPGKSEQELAAEIKRLYDKAYPNQDREVRCEDLLNLFFGTLADDDARPTVEFHKDPRDIDEAVDHVVYYRETGRWPKANDEEWRHYSRWAEVDDSDKSGSTSDEDSHAARVGDRPKRGESWQHKKQKVGNANSASEKQTSTPTQQVPTQVEADQAKQI